MRGGIRTLSLCVFASASLGVVGCSHSASVGFNGRLVVQHDTIGDTVVVRTVSGSVWGAARTLVPEVSIGKESGDSTYLFGQVRALAVAPDGTIYVLDGQTMEIRAYGPEGKYVRTIGRRGGGPGELENADGMLVLSDGHLLVNDLGNQRIQVYGPDGSPLAEWRAPQAYDYMADPLWRNEHDQVYLTVLRHGTADVMRWHTIFLRIGPDGAVLDTVEPPASTFRSVRVKVTTGRINVEYALPFSATEFWGIHPSGAVIRAVSTAYRIDLLRTNAPVLRLERMRKGVPVTAGEKAAAEERIVRMIRQMSPGWTWKGPAIPDDKPPFKAVLVGRHGRIWVELSMPAAQRTNPDYDPKNPTSQRTLWIEPTAFDVFEPDGTYLGRVRAPSDFINYPSPVFDGDHVWAVTRDSLDVERVVRYRVAADTTGAGAS